MFLFRNVCFEEVSSINQMKRYLHNVTALAFEAQEVEEFTYLEKRKVCCWR